MLGQPFLVLARLLSTQMGDIQRERNGARSLELGAKKFYEQRTTGPLLFNGVFSFFKKTLLVQFLHSLFKIASEEVGVVGVAPRGDEAILAGAEGGALGEEG